MTALFSITLFLSAALLFLVQPMIGKSVLPLLGGAPAVWTTCMLFFQVVLLAAYAYAWLTPRWIGPRSQAVAHVLLFVAAATLLPFEGLREWTAPVEQAPVLGLLSLLTVGVGLPFFCLAASAPLLQAWFTGTGHPHAKDPYFLYSASNLGSMIALLSYSFLVEPWLTLDEQRQAWRLGLLVVCTLTALCAAASWRNRATTNSTAEVPLVRKPSVDACRETATPIRWTLLALFPSSLLLGITTYLTTDLAAVPLLWIVPLAIYLLTFTLTFARRPPLPHRLVVRVLPVAVVAVALAILLRATWPLELIALLHLFVLFVACMVCHGELARTRPSTTRLGSFYFCIALGGALGGAFNGIVAPHVFPGLYEYPAALVLVCVMAPPAWGGVSPSPVRADCLWPLLLGVTVAALVLWAPSHAAVVFGVAAVLCYTLARRPIRFGLGLAALFIAGTFQLGPHGRTIYQTRDFFGVHRVVINPRGTAHLLLHGNTEHGMQWLDAARRQAPLTYYHRRGPIGSVFDHLASRGDKRPVAVIGLGTGAIASYALTGQEFTFYEIDPAVLRIAQSPDLFTYLRDSQGKLSLVQSDGRLALAKAPPEHFGLIVIDAFNSDSIPMHLLTREAVAIYRAKLAKDGILAFHVSNRYLDLAPVLGDIAGAEGMASVRISDVNRSTADREDGLYPSQWVLMATRLEDLPRWKVLPPRPGVRVWTDSFCNLTSAISWEN